MYTDKKWTRKELEKESRILAKEVDKTICIFKDYNAEVAREEQAKKKPNIFTRLLRLLKNWLIRNKI